MEKWERILAVVRQHSHLLQFNPARQFQQLVITRLLRENFIVFLLQYMGLSMSFLQSPLSPLWLAAGTASAFIFLRGYSILPGIWLGSFFAFSFAKAGIGIALGAATIFSLQAALLLWVSFHYISPTLVFYNRFTFIKFVLYLGVLTAAMSLMLISLCSFSLTFFLPWWLANFGGTLVVACTIVTWDMYFAEIDKLKRISKLSLSLSYGLLTILVIELALNSNLQLIILIALPLLVFISVRFGWCGAVSAAFLMGMLITFFVFFRVDYFSFRSLVYLQIFLVIGTMISLLVAKSTPHPSLRADFSHKGKSAF